MLTAGARGSLSFCCGDRRASGGGTLFRLDRGVGGADRARTDDPLLAKQVLSQLSYSPIRPAPLAELRMEELRIEKARWAFSILNSQFSIRSVVGLGRFELPTSRLSGVRSKPTEL